jgi:hypothetical protein
VAVVVPSWAVTTTVSVVVPTDSGIALLGCPDAIRSPFSVTVAVASSNVAVNWIDDTELSTVAA